MTDPVCPKCRSLGLSEDCADRLLHAQAQAGRAASMTAADGHTEYMLEVALTFPVPVTSSIDLDPHQMATHMRETWIDEEGQLQDVAREAIETGDYELIVKPVFFQS